MKKIYAIVLLVTLSLVMTSCYRQGYGCKGNSRNILRVKPYY